MKKPRESMFKKLALEREAKRLARLAAGEPAPVSQFTAKQAAQLRQEIARPDEILVDNLKKSGLRR